MYDWSKKVSLHALKFPWTVSQFMCSEAELRVLEKYLMYSNLNVFLYILTTTMYIYMAKDLVINEERCKKYICSSHWHSLDVKGNGVITILKMCQSFLSSKQHTLLLSTLPYLSKFSARKIVTYTGRK